MNKWKFWNFDSSTGATLVLADAEIQSRIVSGVFKGSSWPWRPRRWQQNSSRKWKLGRHRFVAKMHQNVPNLKNFQGQYFRTPVHWGSVRDPREKTGRQRRDRKTERWKEMEEGKGEDMWKGMDRLWLSWWIPVYATEIILTIRNDDFDIYVRSKSDKYSQLNLPHGINLKALVRVHISAKWIF